MYNVTSAVIQALTTSACFTPLMILTLNHLQTNREFFQTQLDRFKRPEARLRDIQRQEYR